MLYHLPEKREHTKERLKLIGKWNDFQALRNRLKSEGYEPGVAHRAALSQYPDPRWGEDILSGLRPVDGVNTTLKSKPTDKVDPVVAEANQIIVEKPNSPEKRAKRGLIPYSKLKEWEETHKGEAEPNAFDENAWIAKHINVDVAFEDAISPGAWAYLQEIQTDREVKKAWRKDVYPKMLPSRSVIEQQDKLKTSDTKNEDLIARLQRNITEELDEDTESEV